MSRNDTPALASQTVSSARPHAISGVGLHLARLALLTLLTLLTLFAAPARAYTISTGFSEGCHERITAQAFGDIVTALTSMQVDVPEDGTWRQTAEFLVGGTGIDATTLSEQQLFVLHSLLVGIRAPDTDGHAVLNLDSARALHTDPDPRGQYQHALRATDDDGDAGNVSAVAGTRLAMTEEFQRFRDRLLDTQQNDRVAVYFDFYGRVTVDVWAPAFHIGGVAHALQDSFSHSIRHEGDGFHTLILVLNFAEAVTGTLDEARDGFAHSAALDSCGEETAPIVAAATAATADLMQVAIAVRTGTDVAAFEPFLDRWVTLRQGCDASNALCGNQHWLDLAQTEPTGPYICSAGVPHNPMRSPLPLAVGLFACVAAGIRRHRARR